MPGQGTESEPRVVEIDFVEDQIFYKPASLFASRGHFVQWRCDKGPFTVGFRTTPFSKVTVASERPADGVHANRPVRIRDDAPVGHYHYAAAVARQVVDRGTVIHLDVGCPEIIIEM